MPVSKPKSNVSSVEKRNGVVFITRPIATEALSALDKTVLDVIDEVHCEPMLPRRHVYHHSAILSVGECAN
jgi:hypothetical protein